MLDEVIELLTGRGEIFGLANLFELTDDITAVCLANVAVKIALKMNPAPLKLSLRVVSLNGALKSDHTIRDKQLNVGDSPLAQSAKQLRPDDPVFRWGNTVVQHLFCPITANTDHDIDCLSLNGITAQRNVGCVQEDTDIPRLLELPVVELFDQARCLFGNVGHRRWRIVLAIHLLDQFGDFSRRNAFGVHHDDRFFKR